MISEVTNNSRLSSFVFSWVSGAFNDLIMSKQIYCIYCYLATILFNYSYLSHFTWLIEDVNSLVHIYTEFILCGFFCVISVTETGLRTVEITRVRTQAFLLRQHQLSDFESFCSE